MMVTVVISHFEFLGIETPNLYASYFHNGSLAVHFFFLMSGFGLTYKYQTTHTPCMERTWTLWRGYKFGMRKMQKLYKWYVLSLLLMLPSTLLILWHTQGITAIPNTCAKLMISLTLLQSASSMSSISCAFNNPCWFLSTLLLLYALYPLLEHLNRKFITTRSEAQKYLLIVFVLRLLLLYPFRFIAANSSFDLFAHASPFFRIFDFEIGILLCYLFVYNTSAPQHAPITAKKTNGTLAETMVFALAIGWWIGRNAILWERYEEVKYTLDIFFAALLLYVFAFEGGKLSRLFHSQTLVVLGNISMYIYIFHFPIVSLLCTQVLGSQSYGSILQPQESTLAQV